MHIAYIAHKAEFQDGQGRVNYEIVRATLHRGHHITVIAQYCSEDIANHPNSRFIQIGGASLPTQLLRNLYFTEKSTRWLRAHRSEFDLVQANGFITWDPTDIVSVHFVHRAWLQNRFFPFLWSSFSPYAYYQRCLALLNAHFEQKTFEEARLLVAVSGSTKDDLIGLGIPAEKIAVVPNGVDVDEFHPGPPERNSFGLPSGVPMALFAGDIRTPRKNLETVLQAMLQVPELHLAVAGDVEGSSYPELARRLGVADRVRFVGKTSSLPALMRSVDFFVMPSRYESYGLVVLEAMASGLSVILSSQVGAAEFAKDICTVIDDPEDVSSMALAMKALLQSPERAYEIGLVARSRSITMQWSNTAEGYLQIYEKFKTGAR